jgi:hypothetical protein
VKTRAFRPVAVEKERMRSPLHLRLGGASLAIGALIAAVASARPALAQERPIVVLPLSLVGRVPAGRPALEAAVAKGIAVAARPIVGAEEVGARFPAARNGACEGPPCFREVGRGFDAAYLIAGVVERRGGLFHASFRLIEPGSGRPIGTEQSECDENECSVAELCRTTARELVRQALGDRAPTGAAPPPPVETPVTPAPAVAPPDQPPAAAARWRVGRVLPVLAIGAGVTAMTVGAVALKLDGDCANTACSRVNDYRAWAWPTLGAGAALAATGLVFALRTPSGDTATAIIGPRGVVIAGRF